MDHQYLFYIAAAFLIIWGIAHLVPTHSVVRGFGDISHDNQRILTMEWLIEGITLVFTGVLTGVVAFLKPDYRILSHVYYLIIGFLLILATVSFFTGFRVKFLPFRLCPFILIGACMLIIAGLIL